MNRYKNLSKAAREERKREKACTSKKAFNSKDDAYQKGQVIYKCNYCGKYHRSGARAKFINQLTR